MPEHPLAANARTPLSMGLADYGGLLFLAVVWSSSFAFIKVALGGVPPLTMGAARLALAATVIALVLRVRREPFPRGRRTWAVCFVVGLIGNALPFTLIAWGEISVASGLAAILIGCMPIATALLAHVVFADERLTPRRAAGVAFGFAGVVTLVGWDALSGIGTHVLAQIAIVGGALCYATTTLFVRRFARGPSRPTAFGACLCGALLLLPLSIAVDRPWTLAPSAGEIASVVVLGVFPTALASLVYFWLIPRVGAGNFSQVNYLTPGLGVLWGVIGLGEQPGPKAWLALALIVAGVWLVTRRARSPRRPA